MYCYDIGVKIGVIDCNGIELAVGDRVKTTRVYHLPSEDGWGRDVPRTTPDIPQTDSREGTIVYARIACGYFVRIDNWADFPLSQFDKIEKLER